MDDEQVKRSPMLYIHVFEVPMYKWVDRKTKSTKRFQGEIPELRSFEILNLLSRPSSIKSLPLEGSRMCDN